MGQQSAYWLHELGRMFLLYLAVGVAFVPFGLIYALLALAGWDHWFVAVVALAGGFLAARFVWAALEKRVFVEPIDVVEEISVIVAAVRAEISLLQYGVVPAHRFEGSDEELQQPEEVWGRSRVDSTIMYVGRWRLLREEAGATPMGNFNYLTSAKRSLPIFYIPGEALAKTAGARATVLLTV